MKMQWKVEEWRWKMQWQVKERRCRTAPVASSSSRSRWLLLSEISRVAPSGDRQRPVGQSNRAASPIPSAKPACGPRAALKR